MLKSIHLPQPHEITLIDQENYTVPHREVPILIRHVAPFVKEFATKNEMLYNFINSDL